MLTHAPFKISATCRLTAHAVVLNGQRVMQNECVEGANWLSEIYHQSHLDYPKFFKMDNLCKAGFLAAEYLLKNGDFDKENVKEDWGIRLMNRSSSLNDDVHYQHTIQDAENHFPSPALFVYTLANIVTGELCIRHKIGGESSFFVFEKFSAEQLFTLAAHGFMAVPTMNVLLCGWVECDIAGVPDVLLLLLERDVEGIEKNSGIERINNSYYLK